MSKNKSKFGICSICGKKDELTREHIPPKGIFLPPRPENTITVLSCKKCNHDSKLDDEYFRIWVAASAQPESKLMKVWKDKVVKSSFKRSPLLLKKIQNDHKRLLKHHLKTPLKTYDGNTVSKEVLSRACMFEAERINRVAFKIVRGLYYHHFSKPLPNTVELKGSDKPIDSDELIKIIKNRSGNVGGKDGEFIYWFTIDDKKTYISHWVLLFYLQSHLIIDTKINKEA